MATRKSTRNGPLLRSSARAQGNADRKAALDKPRRRQVHDRARNQAAFLEAYGKLGTIAAAAEAVGIDRQNHWNWMHQDESYPARFAVAEELAVQLLEDVVKKRVIEGELEYIPNPHTGIVRDEKGVPIMQRKSNAQRDIAILRAHRPEKYREDRKLEITGANGKPLFSKPEINVVLVTQVMQSVGELLPQLPSLHVIEGEARDVDDADSQSD